MARTASVSCGCERFSAILAFCKPSPDRRSDGSLRTFQDGHQLVVGDETALLGAERLPLREQVGPLLLRHVEAEALDGDPERVDAALFPEDDRPFGPHQL